MDCPCRVSKCMCYFCGMPIDSPLYEQCQCSNENMPHMMDTFFMSVLPDVYDAQRISKTENIGPHISILRPVQNLMIKQLNSSALVVSWETPEYVGEVPNLTGIDVMYQVTYQSEFDDIEHTVNYCSTVDIFFRDVFFEA